nr:cysteine protease precursor TacP [Theileria orientalis]
MVIKAMVSPNLRYTTKRVNDDFKSREDSSYSRKPRSSVARRVLATVVVLSFLVGVSVLSYFVVSKYKALSEFKSSLSEHLTKNFPELEMNKRDSYFDELTHLKPRSSVARRVLATVVVLSFLVGVSVLSYFVVSKYKALSEFKSSLSEHLTKNFPELEMNKRDSYFDELTHLFRANLISNDPKLELEVYMEFESFNAKYHRVYKYDKDRRERFVNFRDSYLEVKEQRGTEMYTKGINRFSDLSFNAKYHRVYKYDKDRRERFVNFRDSYLEVKEQRGTEMYTKGINRFSDLSEKEFYQMFKPVKVPTFEKLPSSSLLLSRLDNPTYLKHLKLAKGTDDLDLSKLNGEDLDWRKAKTVSQVKDQGDCGGCWAFATVGSVESFYLTHKDVVYSLSEQELLDCDPNSFGCNGGFPESALNYVRRYGLASANDLPFVGHDKKCSVPDVKKVKISDYYVFKGKNIMNKSLVVTPTVTFMGVSPEFTKYQGGVYNGVCADKLNHAVLLVGEGYDEKLKTRYWVVKNSWGTDWGEDGYFRLQRTDEGSDMCGILDTGFYPFSY